MKISAAPSIVGKEKHAFVSNIPFFQFYVSGVRVLCLRARLQMFWRRDREHVGGVQKQNTQGYSELSKT